MTLPPLFACHYCGEEVNRASINCLRLVSGWVAGPEGKSIKSFEQDHHKFSHEWCLPKLAKGQTESLF